jgi:hypothetical protein
VSLNVRIRPGKAKGDAVRFIAGHSGRGVLASDLKYSDMPTAIDSDDRDLELDRRCFTSKLAKPQSNGVSFVRVYQDNGKSPVLLHRVIAERIIGRSLTRNDLVRHVDADGLNNRRSNLSIISVEESARTCAVQKRSKTQVKGVCWSKSNKAYQAYGNSKGIRHNLGFYPTIEEATAVRKNWEQKQ